MTHVAKVKNKGRACRLSPYYSPIRLRTISETRLHHFGVEFYRITGRALRTGRDGLLLEQDRGTGVLFCNDLFLF